MGFEIAPLGEGSRLTVFIDYDLPESPGTRWLGHLLGASYARWCVERMVSDAVAHFDVSARTPARVLPLAPSSGRGSSHR
jgi:hypothetical protein